MSSKGKKYTSDEIAKMHRTPVFRERYAKYVRKIIHEPETIRQNLDDWFCRYKATTSDPKKPARGRLDPVRMVTLFTEDTKLAVEACKDKAQYLSDALPLAQMYDKILPNPNSKHQLTEYLSKRGASKLEQYHDRLAHFANCGMRDRLADNLNLAGTAKFNMAIRHKRQFVTSENPQSNEKQLPEKQVPVLDRKALPASWEYVVPFFNHSELWYANTMATSIGCPMPFPSAEILPKDNGERFFSQYMKTLKGIGKTLRGPIGECLCQLCKGTVINDGTTTSTTPPPHQQHPTVNNNNIIRKAAPRLKATPPMTTARHNVPNAVTHRVSAPAVTPQIQQQLPMLTPTPTRLPMWCFPPLQMMQTAPACCWKYKEWLMKPRRVGRPPHHPLCHKR